MMYKYVALAGGILAGSALISQAATHHWTGAENGDFSNTANWTPGVPAGNDMAQFNRPGPNQPALGGPISVVGLDFVTPGGGWTLKGVGPLTLGSSGIGSSGQTSGVNTIAVGELVMGTDAITTWNLFSIAPASGTPVMNVSSAIQLNSSGQLLFKFQRATGSGLGTLNLSGPIAGTSKGGIKYSGTAYARNTVNLAGGAGGSSYDGPTIVSAAILTFEQLANTGSKSSFGTAGAVTVGDNNSFASANYIGPGGTTDRQWLLGGAGGGGIKNNGSGPIALTSTASAIAPGSGGKGNRRLELGGTNTNNNTFAELLLDEGGVTCVTKSESGTWVLANTANSYTGTNFFNGGTLEVSKIDLGGNPSSIGASVNSADHLIFNNATLNYTGSGDTSDRLFQMSGNATLNNNGSGTLIFDNPGAITQGGTGARTLTLGGNYADVNTFACAVGDNTFGGTQTSLVKNGPGTWLLTGMHTYSGTTTVRGGKLLINGSLGSGPVLVGPGATLGGNGGTISGPVTLQGGGTLALGSAVSTLTVKNTLIFNGSSACVMKLAKRSSRPVSDVLQGMSIVSYGGTLTVVADGVGFVPGDSFQLFKATSYSGAFSSVRLPALQGSLSWDTSGLATNGTLKVKGIAAVAALPAGKGREPGKGTPTASAPTPRPSAPTETASSARMNPAMWLIGGALVVVAGVLVWVVIALKRVMPNQNHESRSSVSFAVEEQAPGANGRSAAARESNQEAVERVFASNGEPDSLSPAHQASQKGPKEGFRGELRHVGLQDIIQLQCVNSKSCILEISDQDVRGRVFIDKGEIIHAEVQGLTGEPALFKLLGLIGGEFSLKPYEASAERTINGPWVELLMEAARLRDEAASASQDKRSEGFRAADCGTDDVLSIAALLQDHPQVKELVVCSDAGAVLHRSGSDTIHERGQVCASIASVTKTIAPLLDAGDCKQVEFLTEESKSVLMAEQGCNLFVRFERTGSDLPL